MRDAHCAVRYHRMASGGGSFPRPFVQGASRIARYSTVTDFARFLG